jgi:hypothetical protein
MDDNRIVQTDIKSSVCMFNKCIKPLLPTSNVNLVCKASKPNIIKNRERNNTEDKNDATIKARD